MSTQALPSSELSQKLSLPPMWVPPTRSTKSCVFTSQLHSEEEILWKIFSTEGKESFESPSNHILLVWMYQ